VNRPPTGMDALAARGPRRTGPGPFVVLALVSIIPAVALFSVWSWANAQTDETEGAPIVPAPIVDPPLPPDPLTNSVMSFRRMATTLSLGLNVEEFQADAVGFSGALNDRSCSAISVDGRFIGAQNPDLAVLPASTIKLVVAAVALDVLGPDHRYTTTVVSGVPVADGVIDGDLVIVGGGDPLLSSDWYPTSNLEIRPVFNETSLDDLADRVVAAGVTTVNGGVVGDGDRYDDEFFAPGWGNGVAGLEAGPYDALMVNDSRVLGEDQRGRNPSSATAREFARLLRERNVTIAGDSASGSATALGDDRIEIASIDSVALVDVIAEMLQNSDNNTAELMVKEIGLGEAASADAAGGTRQAGLDVMATTLAEWGIDTSAIVLGDGSGLALSNRLTCAALLTVLQRPESADAIAAGLPVAGRTGTLADIFVEHPVAGRLLGKTGTLNNPPFNEDPPATKALAGYLPVDGGGRVEYVLVLNGPTISDQSEYRPVWGELVDLLDLYPSGPSPADLGLLS